MCRGATAAHREPAVDLGGSNFGSAQTRAKDRHFASGDDRMVELMAAPRGALFSPFARLALDLLLDHALDDLQTNFEVERFKAVTGPGQLLLLVFTVNPV